jgi:hypothetical protein
MHSAKPTPRSHSHIDEGGANVEDFYHLTRVRKYG